MEYEKRQRIIRWSLIVLGISGILFLVIYQLNSSKRLLENERSSLQREITELKNSLAESRSTAYSRRKSMDSLFRVLRPYMPYEAMVKSYAQRDSVTALLPIAYGEPVMVLPDSTRGILEGIVFGGNRYENYVKYRVLLKNQTYIEVNPIQVVSFKTNK